MGVVLLCSAGGEGRVSCPVLVPLLAGDEEPVEALPADLAAAAAQAVRRAHLPAHEAAELEALLGARGLAWLATAAVEMQRAAARGRRQHGHGGAAPPASAEELLDHLVRRHGEPAVRGVAAACCLLGPSCSLPRADLLGARAPPFPVATAAQPLAVLR